LEKEQELLDRLKQLPDGEQKARRDKTNDRPAFGISSVIGNIQNMVGLIAISFISRLC
jgi:hypothetical protein